MSDDENASSKKIHSLAQPHLEKLDALIKDFKHELEDSGFESQDAFFVIAGYLASAAGGVSAIQLQKEALAAQLKALVADDVLDFMEDMLSRSHQNVREGFLGVLIRKFGLDYETLHQAEQERLQEKSFEDLGKNSPKDPKDFN
jgi:hypothetical protein